MELEKNKNSWPTPPNYNNSKQQKFHPQKAFKAIVKNSSLNLQAIARQVKLSHFPHKANLNHNFLLAKRNYHNKRMELIMMMIISF